MVKKYLDYSGLEVLWTKVKELVSSIVVPTPSSSLPKVAGTANAGTSAEYSRADHVHPAQTTVDTASKLSTSTAGTATNPVYFASGVPKACTHTLEADVPSDAKFTDTVYTHPSTHPASMINSLTPNTVAVSDSTGKLVSSTITTTELNYLSNVKSDIQTQIDDIIEGGTGASVSGTTLVL